MKKLYFLFPVLLSINFCAAETINFIDQNFKIKLLEADVSNQISKNILGNYFKIDANNDGEIQVLEALEVSYLDVSNSTISSIDEISNFSNLVELRCYSNEFNVLNVNNLINLKRLYCMENQIETIDVSNLINLEFFYCSQNLLTSLNLNGLINLQKLSFSFNLISSIDFMGLTNLTELYCNGNTFATFDLTLLSNLQKVNCANNQLTEVNVTGLNNLKEINCSNNQLTTLTLSNLINLEKVNCSNNTITALNFSGSNNLKELNCSSNTIPQSDIINLSSLLNLNYGQNQLTDLDLTNLPNLTNLSCGGNLFTSLTLIGVPNLKIFDSSYGVLTALDLSNCPNLESVFCYNNQIQILDFTNLNKLSLFNVSNNQLNSLFIRNGKVQSPTLCSLNDNPNLAYVCIDDDEVNFGNFIVYLYPACTVNTYCSFNPGGIFYTIQGNTKFDYNANGCDVLDVNNPYLKLVISNGTTSGNLISNNIGSYTIPVQAGTYTIVPILENPLYFNISPSATAVTFPSATSPYNQDFCITANGIHNDLEVTILPANNARPGFDAKYKIIIKNKGTNNQSGFVNLSFNDAILDFVSASPIIPIQTTNNLTWSFVNLAPFETREIVLTLNLNSPTETPSVNVGDTLNYTTTISSLNDETPLDNTSILNQIVVNSFDPNDKTCLEGTTVSPSMVGQYVHYMIRFENNGTANAENIVVKDMIDTNKFDIASLLPISSSHSFITRITATNKVEFIFENINLPFDDANNDGYVAFKIKTKPTLVVGNTFSNNASIYFDYNAPIVTNTATTTIQALGTTDFDFSTYFALAPNPAKDVLNMQTKNDVVISSASIYNTIGQLVLVVTEPNSSIDVSTLKTGNYFIKVISNKGNSVSKFLKE